MAHLGVLRVLRRARVTVAGVAGTSVGGVIEGHAGQRPRRGAAGRPLRRRRRLGAVHRMRAARNKERFFHGSPLADLSDSDT
jgi:predicted acylesterase/phospholipase RssA